jgi:polysaccharide biosynthesis transport protein
MCGRLGVQAEGRMAVVLRDGIRWRDQLIKLVEFPDLHMLVAGAIDSDTADLIGTRLPTFFQEARTSYDLIVVDAPPVLGFPEPLEIAAAVDAVVMLAKAGGRRYKALGCALNSMRKVRANLLGIVLNQVREDWRNGSAYLKAEDAAAELPARAAAVGMR